MRSNRSESEACDTASFAFGMNRRAHGARPLSGDNMKIRIRNDLYDVADRIKVICPDYEIFYDTTLKRYEVFAKGRLQVVCPFEKLDCRLVEYLNKTRIERLNEIMKEIDEENLKIEAAKAAKLNDEVEYKSKNIFRYYEKHPDAAKVNYEEI